MPAVPGHDLPVGWLSLEADQKPNGESAEFKHTGVDKNVHKLHLTLPKSKVNVDVTAPLKKVFFQAGMKHGNGMLILAMFLAPSDGAPIAPAAASKP